jgi:hypothetical protein
MAETKQVGIRLPLDLWRQLNAWVGRYEIHHADGKVEKLTVAKVVKGLLLAAIKARIPPLALIEEALPAGAKIVEKQ